MIKVAVIENFKVDRVTLVDEWFFKDPTRTLELVNLANIEPEPQVGWFYIKGDFYPDIDLALILFRLKTINTKGT